MTAVTSSPYREIRATSSRSPKASGVAAVTSTVWPSSSRTCTSSLWRERSNPAYNMRGLLVLVPQRTHVLTTEALLHDIQ
jgi:hypothetical protein